MSSQPTTARPGPDRRSSTAPKRTSMLPKPSSIALDPSVLIAQHAQITGTHPITLGPNTVLHPHSKISSALAPVVLGEGVVVYERAKVGLGTGPDLDAASRRSSMASARNSANVRSEGTLLGRNVVVESNAIVEAAEVGEGSVIEVGAVLGRGCVVGKYCTVSSSSFVPPNTRLPDFTVVYSGSEQRRDKTLQLRPDILEARNAVHAKQLDMFKKLIANNVSKWTWRDGHFDIMDSTGRFWLKQDIFLVLRIVLPPARIKTPRAKATLAFVPGNTPTDKPAVAVVSPQRPV